MLGRSVCTFVAMCAAFFIINFFSVSKNLFIFCECGGEFYGGDGGGRLLFCPAWWRSWAFYALLDQPPGFLAHPDDTLGTVRVATGFEM